MTEPATIAAQWNDLMASVELGSSYAEKASSQDARQRLIAWEAQEQGDRALEAARRNLLPGLLIVEDKFLQIPRQWPGVFRRSKSTLNYERFAEARYTGLARLHEVDNPIIRDAGKASDDRFVYNIEHHPVALAAEITKKEVDDGSYLNAFADVALGLANAFVQTEEILHANVLECGHVFKPAIGGDGVALFAANHPYDGGVYSNTYDCLGLDEPALQEIAVRAKRMPLAGGAQARVDLISLVVPIELELKAARLIKRLAEEADPDQPPSHLPREGYRVLDYLRNPRAWFVTTSIHGLASIERAPFRLDLKVEGDKLVLEATQRYAVGHYNPRACFRACPAE